MLPVFWLTVLGLVVSGGWPHLARFYRRGDQQPTVERRFRSITVIAGWLPCNYSGCVTVGANPDGLFLRVFPLFRPFHPPLFIPWSATQAAARQAWYGNWVELTFPDVPGVKVRLPNDTVSELAEAVGGFGSSPTR